MSNFLIDLGKSSMLLLALRGSTLAHFTNIPIVLSFLDDRKHIVLPCLGNLKQKRA